MKSQEYASIALDAFDVAAEYQRQAVSDSRQLAQLHRAEYWMHCAEFWALHEQHKRTANASPTAYYALAFYDCVGR